ncbi:hypothetical protein BT93_L0739 [Corymbia citriodora subsp. variegata]|uniref:Uncharacterized protein n=1 Tax=Corymbia citriodora subsp. variegata TaxID=360336 RepID=A0A8T0CP89_CORYI|nr:hypothetical protein BT93_L0739 [Corymbia citriodora subsp. variegata]
MEYPFWKRNHYVSTSDSPFECCHHITDDIFNRHTKKPKEHSSLGTRKTSKNTKTSGNEGSVDNIRRNDDQSTKHNSPSDGGNEGSEISEIHVSSEVIGRNDGRPAAVKRLLRYNCDVADNEIDILKKSDLHDNIVRYYGVDKEKDQYFVYLALERCTCSLDDLIQASSGSSNNPGFPGDPASIDGYKIKLASVRDMIEDKNLRWVDSYPSPSLRQLMRDMVLGFSQLHGLGIIHRDLKPSNVLIAKNPFHAKLSDMGISKCLPKNKSSLGFHATGCGTTGWRAPELLAHGGRQTVAMDLFSLGCVLFFCVTCGGHPFGKIIERDTNIASDNIDLSSVEKLPEAHDLFSHLLSSDPILRPEASQVPCHPFFWDSEKRLSFFHDVSDSLESEPREGNLNQEFENIAQAAFDGNWGGKIDAEVADLRGGRRTPYSGSSVRDLLRLVRNKFNHLEGDSERVKEILGSVPDGLDAYFARKVPKLLIESYKAVPQIWKEEDRFKKYF